MVACAGLQPSPERDFAGDPFASRKALVEGGPLGVGVYKGQIAAK